MKTDPKSEVIELRKMVLREVGRYFNVDALRPHEIMDLECRLDEVLDAEVGRQGVADEALKLMQKALLDSEQEWQQAQDDVRSARRGIQRLEILAGKR